MNEREIEILLEGVYTPLASSDRLDEAGIDRTII